MRIRYLSDTHLECYSDGYERVRIKINCTFTDITPDEILVVAGNVGFFLYENGIELDYENFLRFLKTKWETIILVPGSFEYRGFLSPENLIKTEVYLKALCEEMGIHYLQKDTLVINGVTFIGCTLWNFLTERQWKYLYDEKEIFRDREAYNLNHISHLEWLSQKLEDFERKNTSVIVVTNFPPFSTYKKYKVDNMNYLTYLMNKFSGNIIAWIHGTQKYTPEKDVKIRALSNLMGDPDESLKFCNGLLKL